MWSLAHPAPPARSTAFFEEMAASAKCTWSAAWPLFTIKIVAVRCARLTALEGLHMAQDKDTELTEAQRKEIFLAVVDAQDHDLSVAESRKLVAERFGITVEQLRAIENEGLKQQWPPL
jgi:hypothetical protein